MSASFKVAAIINVDRTELASLSAKENMPWLGNTIENVSRSQHGIHRNSDFVGCEEDRGGSADNFFVIVG